MKKQHGDKADRIIEVFRGARPNTTSYELFSVISAAPSRQNAVTQAERKSAQGSAPAYLYWFQWQTPVLDGRGRAFHCSELPFVFYNTDRCANMTGGGAQARELSAKIADAWISFARKGDPNHPGLPNAEYGPVPAVSPQAPPPPPGTPTWMRGPRPPMIPHSFQILVIGK